MIVGASPPHHVRHNFFHEIITTAWMMLLATHDEQSFTEFLASNEHRLNPALLYKFWTPPVLNSEAARLHWVPRDKTALPARGWGS
jgi:hypothetical protein